MALPVSFSVIPSMPRIVSALLGFAQYWWKEGTNEGGREGRTAFLPVGLSLLPTEPSPVDMNFKATPPSSAPPHP